MDRGTVSRIEDWESSSFSGGFAGLHDLAAANFSGAITDGTTWLFLLNGRVVGVFGGTIDSFEAASGTAYRAPDPVLPLLFAMRHRDGETQATYYTDDTPLSEVDQTLTEGNFTGYVELSENVLSGDYYVVYYGGRSMSAAFIGSAERVLTGDEAFSRANNEVGIYEVRSVDVDVTDIPDPGPGKNPTESPDPRIEAEEDPSTTEEPADGSIMDGDTGFDTDDDRVDDQPNEEADSALSIDLDPQSTDEQTTTDPVPDTTAEEFEALDPDPSQASSESISPNTDPNDRPPDRKPEEVSEAHEPTTEPSRDRERTDPTPETSNPEDFDHGAPEEMADAEPVNAAAAGDAPTTDPFSEEAAWRQKRTVPALDPGESREEQAVRSRQEPVQEQDGTEMERSESSPEPAKKERTTEEPETARLSELKAALEDREATIRRLEEQLNSVSAEREALEDERDQLARRVEEAEADTGEQTAQAQAAQPARSLSAKEALAQTDVFVRYGSKGKATLQTAHGGETDREEVNANLRLENHTRFESEEVAVDGEPFEAFIEGALEHRFVRWVVEDLIYEIRDTGNQRGLRDLYDVLPRIDRAEFGGTIVMRDEEGEERHEQFDVVMRDRMGQPLLVAKINDARDPATGDMMVDLVEGATAVGDVHESFDAAFLVTSSFFEPDALETAAEATGGGFLNREKKQSYVKLSRKHGYHLCLVEARGDDFHVAVPEL